MLTMLNSEEVRLSILRKQVPDHLRVIRGSALEAARTVWKRVILLILSEITLIPASSAWIQYFYPSTRLNVSFLIIYVSMFLLVGMVFSCIAAATAKNLAIVLLPEGWLQFNEINSNLPNTRQDFWYATIMDIQLNSNFLFGPYLVIRPREGKTRKWYPHPWYPHPARMMLLQSILTDYVTYKRSFKECI
jgi:hypothetical protein